MRYVLFDNRLDVSLIISERKGMTCGKVLTSCIDLYFLNFAWLMRRGVQYEQARNTFVPHWPSQGNSLSFVISGRAAAAGGVFVVQNTSRTGIRLRVVSALNFCKSIHSQFTRVRPTSVEKQCFRTSNITCSIALRHYG